jgi:hypothetical protein
MLETSQVQDAVKALVLRDFRIAKYGAKHASFHDILASFHYFRLVRQQPVSGT